VETYQQELIEHNARHGITAPAHNRSVPDPVWDHLKQLCR